MIKLMKKKNVLLSLLVLVATSISSCSRVFDASLLYETEFNYDYVNEVKDIKVGTILLMDEDKEKAIKEYKEAFEGGNVYVYSSPKDGETSSLNEINVNYSYIQVDLTYSDSYRNNFVFFALMSKTIEETTIKVYDEKEKEKDISGYFVYMMLGQAGWQWTKNEWAIKQIDGPAYLYKFKDLNSYQTYINILNYV